MFSLEQAPKLFRDLKVSLTQKGLDALIIMHMPLATAMARKFNKINAKTDSMFTDEDRVEEFEGVANLAIVEAVHAAYRYMTHDEISRYIAMYIRNALMKAHRENAVVTIPKRQQDRYFQLGYLVRIEIRPLEQEDCGIIYNDDLLEAMIEVIPEMLDRQVLTLRLQSYTDVEISLLLNKKVREIRDIRTRLKKLLLELLEDE